MKERILIGLDLGSSHIRVAVGQVCFNAEKHNSLNIIGVAEAPSKGISKGCISSLEDAVTSVSNALEQAERLVGVPMQEAYVGIGGTHIGSAQAKGVIGVSRPDGDIRSEDVTRVLESARAFINPANQEILHILPREFSVDGQGGIKDPIGMQGIRLEAEVQVIQGLLSHIRNITKVVFRTGVDVNELVYTPLAAVETVTQPKFRELGVGVLIIGATTTGLAVYEDGELLYATTLSMGGDHITSDIAIGLRVSLDVAENVKRVCGHAVPSEVDRRQQIDLKDFGADQSEIASVQYISEIIEARVEELCEKVDEHLKKIGRAGMLPAGIVLTGGGAKLPGVAEVVKRVLQLPCTVGFANVQTPMPELVLDPRFSTSVGLVLWGYNAEHCDAAVARKNWSGDTKKVGRIWAKFTESIKRIFKSFVP